MERRTNQGGSVASFIVISVILVVGLVSAVYFLSQRGQQARKEQTIETSSKDQTTKSTSTSIAKKTTTENTSKSTSTKTTPKSNAQKLPATGPELSIVELIGIYLLTTSMAAFVLSRRSLVHSL